MAKQSSTVWILSIVFVCALAAVAFLLFRDDAGELDSEGNKIVTTGEGRSGAEADSIAIGEGTEPKPGESSRTNASAAIEEALPAEIGETVVVRGKLIVEETNAPPKNAIVSIRTGRDELDYAWMISQVGGKTVYDRLQRTGELELKFLENGGWKATFRMQARPDGSFELRVPKKAVRFTFEVVADFAAYTNPEWIYLSPSTLEKSLTVVLNEAGAIEGKIVNESGQPIAGAYVMADMNRNWNPGRPTMLTTQLTTSGKDGKFTFRGLTPGGTNMTVLAEGYGIENESNTKVEAGKTTNVEFKLQPEVPAQGLVVDAQGQGVADVTIRVYPENRGYSRSVLGYAKSDAQGRIRWKHLLAGTYKSYGSPETHRIVESPETITLPLAAGAAPPKWVVETGRFVAGRVIMTDGKPASGARVTATTFTVEGAPPLDKKQSGSQRGIAGADGTFRLAGLPNGPFTIVAKLDNVSSQTKTNIAQDTEDVEIQLPTPTGVAGTVVDATTGVGIKTFVLAVVTQRDLDRMGGRPWGWGQTYDKPQISESGEFEVGGLDPETYVVHAEADGYISASVKEIIVKSGEMTRGITLKLTAGATVAGRVIATDNGKPIPGAQVEYVSADEEDNGMRMSGGVKVRSDGSFELRGKTAGRGRITAFHEKYMEASSEIFEVQSGQRIEIPPVALGRGGAIVGIAIGRDGEVLPRSQLNAYYSGRQDSNTRPRHAYRNPNAEIDGSFKMEGLQPGEWTVSAQPAVKDNNWAESQNKQLSTKVIVVEGQTTTVVFTPPKAGGCTLRGRVTRGGKPVSN
ncbi:MAG: carboxypeptidase regulatory-like domain-containing protein, partial [Planctomycetota bacterium]